MAGRLLIDTDVLIDYLRGQAEAVVYLESLTEPLLMSAVTLAELHAGVREGAERTALDTFVTVFEVVPVDVQVAMKGGLYRRDYRKSHNLGLADALIAATAEAAQATLVTLNKKHFPMLGTVVTPYQKGP
jgi:predicted nucleic acid-binding protein